MKILITGAHGFVGQHVVKELQDDYDLWVPTHQELDLLECLPSEIEIDLFHEKIDAIVHLAATCGGIGINKDNPGKFIYENLQMGINVLEAARLAGISKVVNLGSVCAYPKFTEVPFQETDLWNGYPEETNAPYGIAKKTIIEMSRAYHQQYGLNVTNLLPANMYGEYDDFDLYSSHVIPALIRKFEQPLMAAGESMGTFTGFDQPTVELWGTGQASREFLYAGDLARAVSISLERNTGPEPINIGTGEEITIAELAAMIKRVGGYDAEIEWDNSQPDGQPRRCLDITRAKNVLRWEPRVPVEEGLRRTIKWYRKAKQR